MASEGLHEEISKLRPETLDHHRAIVSLMEELEAVDWYAQRVDGATDDELREILAHNRDEEKEHACMLIEWLRRRDSRFAEELKTYLFSDGPLVGVESVATGGAGHGDGSGAAADGSLGIGSLKRGV